MNEQKESAVLDAAQKHGLGRIDLHIPEEKIKPVEPLETAPITPSYETYTTWRQ